MLLNSLRIPDIAQKMRWHYTRGSNHTGYVAMGQEVTGDATGVDLKEGLDYHLEIPPDDEDADFPFYGGPNLWVDEPRGLRELLQRYFAIMLDKNYRVFDALMQSLGYPQDHFADTVSKPIAVLSVRRYPFQAGEITRAELGASPHTDYGYCTLIAQDGTPGLEAQNSAGQWIEVPPLDEAFSCNLARKIHEFGKKEGLRCVRKTLLQALSHTQEAFTCETIPHDSL